MYVYEEQVNGRKLTEIINEQHENVKYLPGYKFPPNVVSRGDREEMSESLLLSMRCVLGCLSRCG